MKNRFRIFQRGPVFYSEDNETGKQESLRTKDKAEAEKLLHAKNEAYWQPALNLQMARVYLNAIDPEIGTRTWQTVMDDMVKDKKGSAKSRYERAMADKAFDSIRGRAIMETQPEHLLKAMRTGTVATNVFLRRIHNHAVGMNWLAWPILGKKQWPSVEYGEKRAITIHEHRRIIEREPNSETRAYYQMCWRLGGSQSDIANLRYAVV